MIEKIFRPHDILAPYPRPLSEDSAWKVGYATALFFRRSRQHLAVVHLAKYENVLVVGRDIRPHSPALAAALIEGIRAAGTDVVDLGVTDTPLLYFAVSRSDCVGGIQVTGSGFPWSYNGLRICGPKAQPVSSAGGLDDIRRICLTLRVGNTGLQGKLVPADLWVDYRKHVLRFLELRRPVRIVVSACHGVAGRMIPAIFGEVPQLEILPLLFEPATDSSPAPDPLLPVHEQSLRQAVQSQGADLGVAFAGDAESCFFIDGEGNATRCDTITALLARDFILQSPHKGGKIVYDLRCSHVVPEAIRAAGGVAVRSRVGLSFMMKMLAEQSAVFGGTTSGHYYFHDQACAAAPACALARVLSLFSAQDRPLADFLSPFRGYYHSGELSFEVEDKDAKMRELAEAFKKLKIDYLDGMTIESEGWWFNLRKSSTEPMLRLNLEAATPELLEKKLAEMRQLLAEGARK